MKTGDVMRSNKAVVWAIVAVGAALSADSARALEMPGFLKDLMRSKPAEEAPPRSETDPTGSQGSSGESDDARHSTPAPAASGSSSVPDVRIKQIQRGSKKAAVVLDKHCPDIVQPYKLTDNVASVGAFTLEEMLKKLPNLFDSRARSSKKDLDLGASARIAAIQMNWLPMQAEVLYGEKLHQEETDVLDRESRIGKKFYPVADRMLAEILEAVEEPHEYEFKLYLLKNATRNAVARPGGFIYVDQGLIDNPAQHPKAYFALAHEVAHVLQRHETKEVQSMIVDSIKTRSDLAKVMSSVRGNPNVVLAHVKVQKNLFTQHHVDQELQSDSCAARLLSRTFTDPARLAASLTAFLRDLPKPTATKPAPPPQSDVERLGTLAHEIVHDPIKRHPTTQQRYDNLRKIYNEVTGGAPAAKR
jgi:Peptidase family M48